MQIHAIPCNPWRFSRLHFFRLLLPFEDHPLLPGKTSVVKYGKKKMQRAVAWCNSIAEVCFSARAEVADKQTCTVKQWLLIWLV